VQALLRTLDASERTEVVAEINATLDYQEQVQQGGKSVARPPDAALRRMLPAFSAMVRTRLPAKGAAPILEKSAANVPEKAVVQEKEAIAAGAAEK
jgi:hypothetical protein